MAALCPPAPQITSPWAGAGSTRREDRKGGQEDEKAAVHPLGGGRKEPAGRAPPTHPTPTAAGRSEPPAQVRARGPPRQPLATPAWRGGRHRDSPQRLEVPFLEQG